MTQPNIKQYSLAVLLLFLPYLLFSQPRKNPKVCPIKIKVAVVYEDPNYQQYGNKKLHEYFHTPSVPQLIWNDPAQLSANYEKTLEELSGNTIDYEIAEEINADHFFTYLKNDPLKRPLTADEIAALLSEPDWKTLKETGTSYNYNAMVEYYGFDKKRDQNEINEVWVWSFPYCGMYESNLMGKGAFWLNSPPNADPSCTDLLTIMGLNYERDLACALESYGHRFESTMMQVYGWWAYDEKQNKSELTNWEIYTGYLKKYDKYDKGKSHVGNIHFPPNGEKDYDWTNKKMVLSYADEWYDYPTIKEKKARLINCEEWNCTHIGYMKWWFSHIPHYPGINTKDGKLNNWWYYVVNYKEALKVENQLKK